MADHPQCHADDCPEPAHFRARLRNSEGIVMTVNLCKRHGDMLHANVAAHVPEAKIRIGGYVTVDENGEEVVPEGPKH